MIETYANQPITKKSKIEHRNQCCGSVIVKQIFLFLFLQLDDSSGISFFGYRIYIFFCYEVLLRDDRGVCWKYWSARSSQISNANNTLITETEAKKKRWILTHLWPTHVFNTVPFIFVDFYTQKNNMFVRENMCRKFLLQKQSNERKNFKPIKLLLWLIYQVLVVNTINRLQMYRKVDQSKQSDYIIIIIIIIMCTYHKF